VNKSTVTITASSCESLIRLKKQYLEVAFANLKKEFTRVYRNDELIFYLCQLVVTTRSIIKLFTNLLEKASEDKVTISPIEITIIRTHMRIFKELKRDISYMFNISVELH
jgi:hypothetical protein